MEYKMNYIMHENCVDGQGNVYADAVLEIFQKGAGEHGEQMGVGFEKMLQRHLLWVVTHIRYQVCGKIKAGQQVVLTTWPLPATRLGYERNYLICDTEGNELIRGVSLWVLIDTENRRLASGADVYPQGEYRTDKLFTDRIRRLRDFENSGEGVTMIPDESYIDNNGHVNNTKYALMAHRALGEIGTKVTGFQIDYIHEVMCAQPLTLYTEQQGDTLQVKGVSEDSTRMFACSFVLDN